MADELGVPAEIVRSNPLRLLEFWDDFLLRLPLEDFDDDDWFWLQSQIAAFISYAFIANHDARWKVVGDTSIRSGFKYVLGVTGWDGQQHEFDVLKLVYNGLQQRPPAVTQMIADAEVAATVTATEEDT